MRSRDPQVQVATLDKVVTEYEAYFSDLNNSHDDRAYWQARYSRGDALPELRSVFAGLLDHRDAELAGNRERYGNPRRCCMKSAIDKAARSTSASITTRSCSSRSPAVCICRSVASWASRSAATG